MPVLQRQGSYCKSLQKEKAGRAKRRSKEQRLEAPTGKQLQKPRAHQTHQVEEDEEVSLICTLSDKPVSPKVQVDVAGTLLTMDVDTGASMTVIPTHIFSQFLTHVKLHTSKVNRLVAGVGHEGHEGHEGHVHPPKF